MILGLPVTGIACVIDRRGYVARYKERFAPPWLLCKTAFAILIERSAKYAMQREANLEIYFEESGLHEDRDIQSYARALESEGMPFDAAASADYKGLRPDDFKAVLIGQPKRITKKVPMMQIADLLLYPMVKGGYDPAYRPYMKLMPQGAISRAWLSSQALTASYGAKHGFRNSFFPTTT